MEGCQYLSAAQVVFWREEELTFVELELELELEEEFLPRIRSTQD